MSPEALTAVVKSLHSLCSARVRLAEAGGKRMNFPQGESYCASRQSGEVLLCLSLPQQIREKQEG